MTAVHPTLIHIAILHRPIDRKLTRGHTHMVILSFIIERYTHVCRSIVQGEISAEILNYNLNLHIGMYIYIYMYLYRF